MKVEKRGNSVFISHNILTIFFNDYPEGLTIRATVRDAEGNWKEAGKMELANEDWLELVRLLQSL